MKKIDGYLIADFTALITVILFILCLLHKTSIKYLGGTLAVTGILIFVQATFGKAQIINKTGKAICSKPEIEDKPISNINDQESKSSIDGIKMNGIVYKIPDGVHAIATEQNRIKINSIIGSVAYYAKGGLLTTPPDDSWNALFESDC
ncbi:MAG: hypothetical protein PHU62_10055 [Bacteroidales bacterium]|nr:hypothetical protein [Bacteroidales bacterium]MDD2205662.1 hypothetical protein [Bacteroidales bacterium]MDD3915118.1 hypothetical protein [Bacteroidales bacterium]MDD4634892.1 hypothetical protein [Bacteroidales bacterium]